MGSFTASPANGKFIGPDEMKDEMFAQQSMRQTVAIEPSDGIISAPANGIIEMIFPTAHAFGMRLPDGTGLLVHIGVDTVNLKGKASPSSKRKAIMSERVNLLCVLIWTC